MLMTISTRLYNCLRCHCQVMVCQPCDHGQRYCSGQCRKIARRESLKRANKKYQNSLKGRFNNAERQHRFRRRKKLKKKIVTDQGSPTKLSHDLLINKLCIFEKQPKTSPIQANKTCHFCGRPCGSFFRTGFLKKRTIYPYQSNLRGPLGDHEHGD